MTETHTHTCTHSNEKLSKKIKEKTAKLNLTGRLGNKRRRRKRRREGITNEMNKVDEKEMDKTMTNDKILRKGMEPFGCKKE